MRLSCAQRALTREGRCLKRGVYWTRGVVMREHLTIDGIAESQIGGISYR